MKNKILGTDISLEDIINSIRDKKSISFESSDKDVFFDRQSNLDNIKSDGSIILDIMPSYKKDITLLLNQLANDLSEKQSKWYYIQLLTTFYDGQIIYKVINKTHCLVSIKL